MAVLKFLSIFLSLAAFTKAQDNEGVYKIGVGIGDITGPPAGIVLNGYVNPITNAAGIFTRQFARAFVVESKTTGNVLTYVTCDMGMMDHSIKSEVVKKLGEKYGSKFTENNVMISATHTHSGVSGFMTYYAYIIIESYGFNPISYWSIVDGVTEAIEQAVDSSVDGKLSWNRGELLEANGNRRSEAYNNNPQPERDAYPYDTDKDMTILKMVDVQDKPIGVFTWWPVHPISFNGGINPLVSSDNKGYAAILFDYEMNPGARPGKGKFVAGFGSSNLGDVSPRHTDEVETKWDFTPDIARTRQLGKKQFDKAFELFNNEATLQAISGPIRCAHRFIDTETISVDVLNEEKGTMETLGLCKAALGFSYVGVDPEAWPFWEQIRDLIKEPSQEMIECQAPKIVALAAGEMSEPWQWAPSTISIQLFQLGAFDIVGVPGEFTTMSGRRVRNGVFNVTGHEVAIAGLANGYINYIATPEEYDYNEYEGGATIYGRNTLPVVVALLQEMAENLENGTPIEEGEAPESMLDNVRDEIPGWADPLPSNGKPFGAVVADAYTEYRAGELVKVTFNAGSPRNSPMRGGTFLLVEKLNGGTWEILRTDADVDTTFYWDLTPRRAEITWAIPADIEPGTFRIRHFGLYRLAEDAPSMPYSGSTRAFNVK